MAESKGLESELSGEITPENLASEYAANGALARRGKLQLIREASGLSARELADKMDIPEYTYSRLERGKTGPSEDLMNKLRALSLTKSDRTKAGEHTDRPRLTARAVVVGLGAIAAVKYFGVAAGVAATGAGMLFGGVIGGALTYGVVQALKALCSKNELQCRQTEGGVEITSKEQEQD